MTDISPSPPPLTADLLPQMQIAIGGQALRATDVQRPGVIEGYLITFTGPEQKDLYQTYFNAETNYYRSAKDMVGMPILYHHGLDEVIGVNPIGRCIDARFDERGLYIRAQLYTSDVPDDEVEQWLYGQRQLRKQYIDAVAAMAQSGELGWSSGALPQSVKSAASDGWMPSWMPVEGSPTYSEAMPVTNTVISARSYLDALKDRNGDKGEVETTRADILPVTPLQDETPVTPSNDDTPSEKEAPLMDAVAELKQMLQDILSLLTQKEQVSEVEAPIAMEAMEEVKLTDDEMKAVTDPTADETQKRFIAQKLVSAALDAVTSKRAARHAVLGGAFDAELARRKDAPAVSRTASIGAVTQSRVENVTDRRYDAWNAKDMLTYVMVRAAGVQFQHTPRARLTLEHLGFDEGFSRALKFKIGERYLKHDHSKDPNEAAYARSIIPFRANEVDSTTNTGYGLEWAGELWSSDLWEKARNTTGVMERLLAKGAHEYVLARGADTYNVPTEGADPTVRLLTQNNSVDATNRAAMATTPSPFGTGVVTAAPKGLIAISVLTNFLDEDSAVPAISNATRMLEAAIKEKIDAAIMNGDTATGATTNVNLIDGTPGGTEYYLNNNGLLKYPLVTNTALSRDAGGVLNIDTFFETWKLLDPEFGSRTENLLWLMDHFTYLSSMRLPEILTDDVRKQGATLTSGQIADILGIEVFRSGLMGKANTAGKINGTNPTTTNIYGRLGLFYGPHWALVRKREINLEDEYVAREQAHYLIATVRFDFVNRGSMAGALSYKVGLS